MLLKRVAWAMIVLLATYLTFIGGGWLGIYAADLRIASVGLAGMVLATWFLLAWRRPDWRPRSVLWPAIGACFGSLTISTLFSRVPRVSLEYLGYAVLLVALYLLLVRLMAHGFFARRILVLSGMFFIAICVAFLGLVVTHWIEWWALVGHLAIPPLRPGFEGLTYLNPSAVLTMVVLLAVPIAGLVDPASRRWLVAAALTVVLIGLVALITGSRAGWLALALTVLAGGAVIGLDGGRRGRITQAGRQLLGRRARRSVVLVAAAATLASAAALAPAIIRRVTEGGEAARAQFAITAVHMFTESPVAGVGPGAWVVQRLPETRTGEIDYYIPHAHNLVVQTLAELGLVGALAAIIVVVSLFFLCRGAARSTDPTRRRIGWATGLGLGYLAFHQLLDFYANMPAVLFAAAVPIAYLDATSTFQWRIPGALATATRRAGHVASVGLVGAVGLAITGLIAQELPALQSARAVGLANSGDWAGADAPARAAAEADPTIGSYLMSAGLTAARAGDTRQALAYFKTVARRDDLPEAWLDLAALQLELGDRAGSITSLSAASRLGLQRPAAAIGIADLAMRLEQRELALRALTQTLISYPIVGADSWWSDDEARSALLSDAANMAVSGSTPETGWQIALVVGDASGATTLAGRSPNAALALAVIAAWNGDEVAFGHLLDMCSERPLDTFALTWCARTASHAGRLEMAGRFRTQMELVAPASSVGAGMVRVVFNPAVTDRLDGFQATFWGTFTYRRATPVDLLLPTIAHLILQ